MDPTSPPPFRLPRVVAEAIARGASVLTPNLRAAHALRQAHAASMKAEGVLSWTPPTILALDPWMNQLWGRMIATGHGQSMLLNRAQEYSLWRSILAADAEISPLASLDPLIELAADAWRTLCSHQGDAGLRDSGVSADTRAFGRWATAFRRALEKESLLSSAQLPDALRAALVAGTLPLSGEDLLLVDFDAPTPAVKEWLEAIRQSGIVVLEHHTDASAEFPPQYCKSTDEQQELETAARWISDLLQRNAAARIALVVPDLAERKTRVMRVLRKTLNHPAATPALSNGDSFEFSLGTPLAETPMGTVALDLLRWSLEPLPIETISALLLSPFFGANGSSDLMASAAFDVSRLRQTRLLLRPELSLDETIALVAAKSADLESLLNRMRAMRSVVQLEQLHEDRSHPHALWADSFRSVLDAAGWNTLAGRSSTEWQIHRRFESVLDELATLDFDGSRLSAAQALQSLVRLARKALFAPESREVPVQVIGPLELGGVPFDALWFLGAGDLGGLPLPSASPLIPWQLQRALGVPGTDSLRDQAAAAARMNLIARTASHVVFSFAEHTEKGVQRLTPSLRDLELQSFVDMSGSAEHESAQMQTFPDDLTLPPPDPLQPGGARVLELQAACGFRAFAELRLSSRDPDHREPGLNALERGNLVHAVMEFFWADLADQDQLKALSIAERDEHLAACIDRALQQAQSIARNSWDWAYLGTQRKRLLHLLRPWLEMEAARPRFSVRLREQRANGVKLGPLLLTLRPDRIDETSDGLVILDYKTGAARPADWLSDRPAAPQLPLYSVLVGEKVAGVAFALLHAGDGLALKGFADSDNVFGKPARMLRSLDEQMEEWRVTLTALASDFYNGEIAVNPRQYPATCNFCSQRLVCRLDPNGLSAMQQEDLEAETERG